MNLAILILLLKGATLMNKEYLINQRPLKALLVFAFPIMIGNLFQQFYTMADSVVVGRFVGEDALAAVGASYSLTNVFISIHRTAHISWPEHPAGRFRLMAEQRNHAVFEHAVQYHGTGRRIPEYLFSRASLFIYVQCAVFHVQCAGALPYSALPVDILLCF